VKQNFYRLQTMPKISKATQSTETNQENWHIGSHPSWSTNWLPRKGWSILHIVSPMPIASSVSSGCMQTQNNACFALHPTFFSIHHNSASSSEVQHNHNEYKIQLYKSVLWRCWLGGRKGIRPVKNWVVGCWHGYLSGARCRLAYGPADSTATHCLLLQ